MTELKPDNVELTVDILKHISNQMHNVSYGPYDPAPSTPDGLMVAVNGLLFASLAFVLLTAFLSMLVKTWIRDFERDMPPPANAEQRAKEREFRFRGMIRYKLPVVMALPIMLQIALVLFCIGLLFYLRPIRWSVFIVTLSILAGGFALYFIAIFVTIYDRSVSFTYLISRALTYPWHVVKSAQSSLRDFYSACTGPPVSHDDLSLHRFDFMFLRRIRRVFGSWSTVQDADRDDSLDAEVRIMNRIARETLVTPENAPIFVALAERLALDNRLRPCSASEWQEIIATLRRAHLSAASPLGKRGFFRIMAGVYEDHPMYHDMLGGLARKWLLEGTSSSTTRINTRQVGHNDQGASPSALSSLPTKAISTAISPTNRPGTDIKKNESPLPLLAVLTLVPSTLGEIKSLFSERIGIEAASHRIQDRRIYEAIRLDLSWLPAFLRSKLVSDLGLELTQKLKEQTTQCLQEILVVTSFFPMIDCSLLVSAVVQVALARVHVEEEDNPSVLKQTAESSGNLFTASAAVGWLSDEPLSPDDFFDDFVRFMASASNPNGVNASLVAPLLFALQRVDRTSSLCGEHHLEALVTALPVMADRLTNAQKPLTLLRLMEIILAELPVLESFQIFLEFWGYLTRDFSKPLDQHAFDFFDTALTAVVGKGKKVAALQLLRHVRNPWLRIHIDNIFGERFDSNNLPSLCEDLTKVNWSGHPCHEKVVERALDLYDQGSVTPEFKLLDIFTRSTSFRSYMRCIDKWANLKAPPRFDIARAFRLKAIVQRVLEREVEEDMLDDWFVIAEVLHPLWPKLPADWKGSISTVFRGHDRFIDWLQRSMDLLGEPLRQDNPNSGSTTVANAVRDRQRLEQAIAAFLPFIWLLLGAAPPLIAPEEANKLATLNLIGLPDAFGHPETRAMIEQAIKSPDPGEPGGSAVPA